MPIDPLPDRRDWVIPEHLHADLVLPPIFKRLPERPKKKSRDKTFSELLSFKGKNTYSTCRIAGHNGELVEIDLVPLSLYALSLFFVLSGD